MPIRIFRLSELEVTVGLIAGTDGFLMPPALTFQFALYLSGKILAAYGQSLRPPRLSTGAIRL